MLEQLNTQSKSGVVNPKRFLNPDVEDYQPESISRCALRFRSKKMDEYSRKELVKLYQMLAQARKIQ
ncbi:TPA: hypothetical protein RSV59_002524 [Mannheimia haemolytica]|nr:hypothetical protein [Mannheimia haemolytica]